MRRRGHSRRPNSALFGPNVTGQAGELRSEAMPVHGKRGPKAAGAKESFRSGAGGKNTVKVPPGYVRARCMCDKRYVVIPVQWVNQGRTGYCGKGRCIDPEGAE